MNIEQLVKETRRWAEGAENAGEDQMARLAYEAVDLLQQACALYWEEDAHGLRI